MKIRILLLSLLGIALAGCISTPQTKALITPLGAIGIHSFEPPPAQQNNKEFEQRIARHGTAASPNVSEELRERS